MSFSKPRLVTKSPELEALGRIEILLGEIKNVLAIGFSAQVEARRPLPMPDATNLTFQQVKDSAEQLIGFLASDRKIEAIKAFRALTGSGLKESKDAIERVTSRMRP